MEKRLTAQELQQISDFAVSLMQTNPEMKNLIFKLLSEVTQSREQTIYQFLDNIQEQEQPQVDHALDFFLIQHYSQAKEK